MSNTKEIPTFFLPENEAQPQSAERSGEFANEKEFLEQTGKIFERPQTGDAKSFSTDSISESLRQIEDREDPGAVTEINEALKPLEQEEAVAKNNFMKRTKQFLPLLLTLFLQNAGGESTFGTKKNAQRELAQYGITSAQQKRYVTGMSEMLYRSIEPHGYGYNYSKAKEFVPNLVFGRKEHFGNNPQRDDAWRMYLGMPQVNNTFGISEFRPGQSHEEKYYYKINNFFEDYTAYCQQSHDKWQKTYGNQVGKPNNAYNIGTDGIATQSSIYDTYVDANPIKQMLTEIATAEEMRNDPEARSANIFNSIDDAAGVMGEYKLSRGHDEKGDYISYYDNWNLEGSPEGEKGVVGTPFEIYDRIYFNPQTYEIIK